jgi:hypothetical protein
VAIDDQISAIRFLNESDERNRSPVWKSAKDVINLITVAVPAAGVFLSSIENALDRREASNRAELVSAIAERTQNNTRAIGRFSRDRFSSTTSSIRALISSRCRSSSYTQAARPKTRENLKRTRDHPS